MNKIERYGEAVKALVIGERKVPFREQNASMGWGAQGWEGAGKTYDPARVAGELCENRVVAVCVNAISQALQEAPPILERREGDKWEKVAAHPVIDLLTTPNKYYGSAPLWDATAASECTTGQGFWRMEKTAAGIPAEIWWEDSRRFRVLGTTEEFISGYRFQTERGGWVDLDNDDVVHFRHSLNPFNPREGRSPLRSGLRQIALDNALASYCGSILVNSGVMSALVTAKELSAGAATSPLSVDAMKRLIDDMRRKLSGEGAGGIIGINAPVTVEKMAFSPDEMMTPDLMSYAEVSICALLGVDPMVAGLGGGEQNKTYSNLGEAQNDFWERRIIPTKNRHSAELGAQLLPLFGLDPRDYRIGWDYSNVAALQENEDQKQTRIRENYKAGLIDLYDAQTDLGKQPDESLRGVFYSSGPDMGAFEAGEVVEAVKALRRPELKALPAGSVLAAYDADDVLDAIDGAEPETRALMLARVEGE